VDSVGTDGGESAEAQEGDKKIKISPFRVCEGVQYSKILFSTFILRTYQHYSIMVVVEVQGPCQ
jgi:hypothetical protein